MSRPEFVVMGPASLLQRIVVGSIRQECAECGTQCWLSPDGQEALAAADAMAICTFCFNARAAMTAPEKLDVGLLRPIREIIDLPTVDIKEPS